MGAVTGIIGTIVGAFFGIHVGSEGKENAMAERKDAEEFARHVAGFLSPEDFKRLNKELKKYK